MKQVQEIRYSPEVVKLAALAGLEALGLVKRENVETIRLFHTQGQIACKITIKMPQVHEDEHLPENEK